MSEEEIEGNKKDKEEMQDVLAVEEDILINFPCLPSLLSPSPEAPASRIFLQKNK